MFGMTGYSFKESYCDDVYISTEVKSVNHRFLEINVSMPYYLNSMELNIRDLIQSKLHRGKVDVNLSFKLKENNFDVDVDLKLAGKYIDCLKKIISEFNLKDDVKLFHLTRYDDIIQTSKKKDYSKYWDIIKNSFNQNIDEIISMRDKEGVATKTNLVDIVNEIIKNIDTITKQIPVMEQKTFSNIKDKVVELIGDKVDENRLLNEVALMVNRSCINEEVERLKMHSEQFLKITEEKEDVGKRLDFVCQEMHREINTIGSKVTLSELTENVIIVKNNIEKLREQIRNIE
jgi:uncharacterized protein (TIGR00255 family)